MTEDKKSKKTSEKQHNTANNTHKKTCETKRRERNISIDQQNIDTRFQQWKKTLAHCLCNSDSLF